MSKFSSHHKQSGFGLIEVLVASGILALVILGVMGIASTMSDMQSRMTQKFDQMTLSQEARSLLEDAQLCGPSFDGQLATSPLQGQDRDLPYLKWGNTNNRFLEVGTTNPTLKVRPTRIRVSVDPSAPTQFQQADLNTAGHPVITINKYAATLRIEMESATNATQGPGFRATQIPFAILRRSGTNQFLGCHTDYSPAQLCEDEFGGTYDASAVPHCQLTHLGISAPYPTGTTLLAVGTSATVTDFISPSVANINGNITIGNSLRIGTDNRTWFGRNATAMTAPYDLSLYVNSPLGSGTGGRYRFDEYGMLHAHAGFSFNNSGEAPNGQGINATVRATGFYGNWAPGLQNDVVLAFQGNPKFRFSELGQLNAASGLTFNNAGMGVSVSSAQLSSMRASGFYSFFESSLMNDIGVFINGFGLFRFHVDGDKGDFFVSRNVDAGGRIHAAGEIASDSNIRAAGVVQSSDERLKSNIRPLENSLEKISHLHGVSFTWNQSTALKGQHSIGLIAQNVASEYPELVKRDEKGFFTVAYTSLIGAIVEAIKDLKNLLFSRTNALQEVIAQQQLEIQALKARLDKIEKRLNSER